MSYAKINMSHLMPGSAFDWLQKPNKGSMTRQEAVNPTPQQAVAQTAQARPSAGPRQSSGTGNAAGSVNTSPAIDPSWHGQLYNTEQVSMPTRGADGAKKPTPKPGVSEAELNAFAEQEQEPTDGNARELTKKQAQNIGRRRADGSTPEQEKRVPSHREGRRAITAEEAGLGGDVAAGGATYSGYDDIMRMMQANMETEGDMARRQHSREIITGLGDLVSSIANMWATTKGAPNSYDNSKGMTATSQARYDRELARRKAQNESILNYYRVKKAAEDDAETREYRRQSLAVRQQEAERRQAESDAKIKREDDIAKARENYYKLQGEKAQADTIKKKGENQYSVTYWDKYSQYRSTMSHEEADRLANIDAAAAEQEVLNEKREQKANESTAKVKKLNRTTTKGNKGGTKKSTSSNTPPSRRSGNSNGNNTRPSKRK